MSDIAGLLQPWAAEYMAEIRSIAAEYLKGSRTDREDWLHEAIDSHEYVIYTFKARCVAIATDHPEAYQDELGEPPPGPEQAAYMSMCADVRRMAEAIGEDEPEDE